MVFAGSVLAHGAYAKFGGTLTEVDDMYFELVNKNGAATIYVTEDHESDVSTKGVSGKLVVNNGGKKTEVALQASGTNSLDSKGDAKLVAYFSMQWANFEARLKCCQHALSEWSPKLEQVLKNCTVHELDLPLGYAGALALRRSFCI